MVLHLTYLIRLLLHFLSHLQVLLLLFAWAGLLAILALSSGHLVTVISILAEMVVVVVWLLLVSRWWLVLHIASSEFGIASLHWLRVLLSHELRISYCIFELLLIRHLWILDRGVAAKHSIVIEVLLEFNFVLRAFGWYRLFRILRFLWLLRTLRFTLWILICKQTGSFWNHVVKLLFCRELGPFWIVWWWFIRSDRVLCVLLKHGTRGYKSRLLLGIRIAWSAWIIRGSSTVISEDTSTPLDHLSADPKFVPWLTLAQGINHLWRCQMLLIMSSTSNFYFLLYVFSIIILHISIRILGIFRRFLLILLLILNFIMLAWAIWFWLLVFGTRI